MSQSVQWCTYETWRCSTTMWNYQEVKTEDSKNGRGRLCKYRFRQEIGDCQGLCSNKSEDHDHQKHQGIDTGKCTSISTKKLRPLHLFPYLFVNSSLKLIAKSDSVALFHLGWLISTPNSCIDRFKSTHRLSGTGTHQSTLLLFPRQLCW